MLKFSRDYENSSMYTCNKEGYESSLKVRKNQLEPNKGPFLQL